MILLYENVHTICCYYFVIVSGIQDCQQITSDPNEQRNSIFYKETNFWRLCLVQYLLF